MSKENLNPSGHDFQGPPHIPQGEFFPMFGGGGEGVFNPFKEIVVKDIRPEEIQANTSPKEEKL